MSERDYYNLTKDAVDAGVRRALKSVKPFHVEQSRPSVPEKPEKPKKPEIRGLCGICKKAVMSNDPDKVKNNQGVYFHERCRKK